MVSMVACWGLVPWGVPGMVLSPSSSVSSWKIVSSSSSSFSPSGSSSWALQGLLRILAGETGLGTAAAGLLWVLLELAGRFITAGDEDELDVPSFCLDLAT